MVGRLPPPPDAIHLEREREREREKERENVSTTVVGHLHILLCSDTAIVLGGSQSLIIRSH